MEVNKEDYILYSTRIFDRLSNKEFKEKNELGYTPYYFDDKDYVLTELKLDSRFNPLKKNGKQFYNNEKNPYRYIFFLKGNGFETITKLTKTLGDMIKAIDEQKELYLKYPAAVVKKLSEGNEIS